VILDEVNVKSIEYVSDESGLVRKKAKPNFRSIGPRFGKSVQQVAARIKELTGAEITQLEACETVVLTVSGNDVTIAREDVEIIREDIEGWLVEAEGGLTVALDTQLDDALIAEGCAREFVNRVQNMRKEAGFAVTDRIAIFCAAPSPLMETLEGMRSYISAETLAVEFSRGGKCGEYDATLDINGQELHVGIERRL
jgi:isoleucyl-tRNA synthetase